MKGYQQLLCNVSAGGLLAGILLVSMPSAALAQTGSPSDAEAGRRGVADIIVTAQKREENLQDVPVAVTALTRNVIEQQQIQSFNDIRAR